MRAPTAGRARNAVGTGVRAGFGSVARQWTDAVKTCARESSFSLFVINDFQRSAFAPCDLKKSVAAGHFPKDELVSTRSPRVI